MRTRSGRDLVSLGPAYVGLSPTYASLKRVSLSDG